MSDSLAMVAMGLHNLRVSRRPSYHCSPPLMTGGSGECATSLIGEEVYYIYWFHGSISSSHHRRMAVATPDASYNKEGRGVTFVTNHCLQVHV